MEFSFFPVEDHDFGNIEKIVIYQVVPELASNKVSWFSEPWYKPEFPQFPA